MIVGFDAEYQTCLVFQAILFTKEHSSVTVGGVKPKIKRASRDKDFRAHRRRQEVGLS